MAIAAVPAPIPTPQPQPVKSALSTKPKAGWNLKAAPAVARSANPIRATLASVTSKPPSSTKQMINLGLGDPTVLAPPPANVSAAMVQHIEQNASNGYLMGAGSLVARKAISAYHAQWDGVAYDPQSVFLTHGVSHGLEMVWNVIVPSPSDYSSPSERPNVLVPRPGFAQYTTFLTSLQAEIRYYDCIEENNWECDLERIKSACDDNTKAILITNPSNPCGSNFSREHLDKIVAIAEEAKVPIIADEIYGHMTFYDPFVPLAAISSTVPIITLNGLSKRFLLPGWRVGWVALHDPQNVATQIRDGLEVWSNRIFGPNSVLQAALPEILSTPAEWFEQIITPVRNNAAYIYKVINSLPGLSSAKVEGSLYMLVKLDPAVYGPNADVEFCRELYDKQAVFALPGVCFQAPGYIRLVLACPEEVMRDVGQRLQELVANKSA